MSRKKAFLIHFGLSFLIVSTCLLIILAVWYPGYYFQIFAASEVLKVLISVDLVLGPLLTLILFKPGKPGLRFDLAVVATLQICALVYGLHLIYQERPYFTVFAVDRFEVLAQKDINMQQVDPELLNSKSWSEPILVAALMPMDADERNRILEETLFEGKPDIQYRPELWQPYAEATDEIFSKARPVAELIAKVPAARAEIVYLNEKSADKGRLVYLPIMGKQEVYALVLDPSTKLPVGLINQDPWAAAAELPADEKRFEPAPG